MKIKRRISLQFPCPQRFALESSFLRRLNDLLWDSHF
ncbi:hypothetical protein KP509_33G053400 [Ceratopteris richardii]|uniref:Uncharacterized protein n=1 Tax=Ceratopteris richardii TaxID=49495 RepID=A0A8T2QQW7_CERRI|nr:hypothetical protein KP509_33G053400 [Ceratopteris richardii]